MTTSNVKYGVNNVWHRNLKKCSSLMLAGLLFSGATLAQTPLVNATVVLTWTAPTRNTDATPLTDLAGYRVFHRSEGGTFGEAIATAGASMVNSSVTMQLPEGNNYFAMTAVNSLGEESPMSNEIVRNVKLPVPTGSVPEAPTIRIDVFINGVVQ